MSELFEPTEINGMSLKNRFIRSATWEGLASDQGGVTPRLIDHMTQLARGGVGLIITGHAYVSPEGKAGPWQLACDRDAHIEGLREMVRAVHEEGGRIILQISHAGFAANAKLTGYNAIAPSQVEGFAKTPRDVLTTDGIKKIINAFVRAAHRAESAEFDGVQLHIAHAYLLCQFISPVFNIRKDDYGGSVENRARIIVEIIKGIRSDLGNNFPLMAKINSRDFLEGGLTLEDSVQTGKLLQDAGLDLIELSGGTFASGDLSPIRGPIIREENEAYFKEAGKAFKKKLVIPISLVGGIRSFHIAENLVKEGWTDYISMSRPLIREPDLIKRWESGDRNKAACISDSRCFEPGQRGEGIYCVMDKGERKKLRNR